MLKLLVRYRLGGRAFTRLKRFGGGYEGVDFVVKDRSLKSQIADTFLARTAQLKPDPPEEGEAPREQPGAGFNKFLAVLVFRSEL